RTDGSTWEADKAVRAGRKADRAPAASSAPLVPSELQESHVLQTSPLPAGRAKASPATPLPASANP
ncbi:MAG: hypothetical protein ACAI34_01350, partial [Verrucomicrobium sp.]